MMKEIQITTPQSVNACTLISLQVIEAICLSENINRTASLIDIAVNQAQRSFSEDIQTHPELAEGMLVSEAFPFISRKMQKKEDHSLASPTTSDDIEALIANRRGMDPELFTMFNGDLLTRLMIAYGKEPDYFISTSDDKLRQLSAPEKNSGNAPLEEQLLEVIENLKNPEGISLTYEGHTISVAHKDDIYYSFDSATGVLFTTDNPLELANALWVRKIQANQAKEVTVTAFQPKPQFLIHSDPTSASQIEAETIGFEIDDNDVLTDGSIEYRFYMVLNTKLTSDQIKSLFSEAGYQQPELIRHDGELKLFINKRYEEQQQGRPEDASIHQALTLLQKHGFSIEAKSEETLTHSVENVIAQIAQIQDISGDMDLRILLNAYQYAYYDLPAVQEYIQSQMPKDTYSDIEQSTPESHRYSDTDTNQPNFFSDSENTYRLTNKESLQKAKERIEEIQEAFYAKIKTTTGNHSSIAKNRAIQLYERLVCLKDDAFNDPTKEVLDNFVKNTQLAIQDATPILQKDLGWGTYLKNLAKEITNVVYSLFRFDFSFNSMFFKPKCSGAVEAARQMKTDIDNEVSSILTNS